MVSSIPPQQNTLCCDSLCINGLAIKRIVVYNKSMIRLVQYLLLFTIYVWLGMPLHAQFAFPPAAQDWREKAEQGDAYAQWKMGEALFSSYHYNEAEEWFSKAANQGVIDAQWRVGTMYLSGVDKFLPGSKPIPKKPETGIRWLSLAANRGHRQAQKDLGSCYANGKGVAKDLVEAYKWYKVSSRGDRIWEMTSLDPLALTMNASQISEGEKRARAFQQGERTMPDLNTGKIALKGIMGSATNRVALINGEALHAGESALIAIGSRSVRVQCLSIAEARVQIKIDGEPQPRELRLGKE